MTKNTRQLLIECHPDRHGGDHSLMERVYEAMRRPSQAMNAVRRCRVCAVRIGGRFTCQIHRYTRPALTALVLVLAGNLFAGQTTLTWDPVGGATNYILVARTNALNNTNALSSQLRISTGTNLVVTVYDLAPTNTYNFGVMAQNQWGVSDLSNILPVQTPPATTQRVVQAQYAIISTNGMSSFTDALGVAWLLKIGP